MNEKYGRWAFIIGLVISVIAGFVSIGDVGLAALVVLGVIVGFVNITNKEVTNFLLATIALMLVGNVANNLPLVAGMVGPIIAAFTSFVAGAALIVALKEVYSATKNV